MEEGRAYGKRRYTFNNLHMRCTVGPTGMRVYFNELTEVEWDITDIMNWVGSLIKTKTKI